MAAGESKLPKQFGMKAYNRPILEIIRWRVNMNISKNLHHLRVIGRKIFLISGENVSGLQRISTSTDCIFFSITGSHTAPSQEEVRVVVAPTRAFLSELAFGGHCPRCFSISVVKTLCPSRMLAFL